MARAETSYSLPDSRYDDDERCEMDTRRGERCKRAWMVRRSDTDIRLVCRQHAAPATPKAGE